MRTWRNRGASGGLAGASSKFESSPQLRKPPPRRHLRTVIDRRSHEEQCVSDLDANGTELHRYFSVARGALISVRSNGVTLCRQVDDDWKVLSRKKVECSLAQWVANKKAALSSLSRWQLEVEELPSMQELMAWDEDGICETPTGHRVEPDGTGPDGVPSWLRALRLI